MIYDKIENIKNYKGISKWLDAAVDFLEKTDLSTLPMGKTVICEDHVFINVMEAETLPEDKVFFEIHKKYMDIQIDIEGTEMLQIGLDRGTVVKEYQEEIDFGSFECSLSASCILGPGRFVICMTEEPHKPTLTYGQAGKVKKCVIKVEVD
ncbi:MAG: YhcH/YjgK/YiaL family protein [Lachnospiraceae bacterium]|nr:YhcH/YjgK/YiaL family protein [Lachnospiraceae bacterium]